MLPPKNPAQRHKNSSQSILQQSQLSGYNSNNSFQQPQKSSHANPQYRFEQYQSKITHPESVKYQFQFIENQNQTQQPSRQNLISQILSKNSQNNLSLPEIKQQIGDRSQPPLGSSSSTLSTTLEQSVLSRIRLYNSNSQSNSRTQLQNTGNLLLQEIPSLVKNINNSMIKGESLLQKSPEKKKTSSLFIQTPVSESMKPQAGLFNPQPHNQYKSVLTDKIKQEILKQSFQHEKNQFSASPQKNQPRSFFPKTITSQQISQNSSQISHHQIPESEESKKINNFNDVKERFSKNGESQQSTTFEYKPVYSFQKQHPGFQQKIKYSLNYEQQEKLKEEKEIQQKREAENKLKVELEKEKVQNNLGKYIVMNIKDMVLNRQQYKEKLLKDQETVKDIVAYIKRRFVDKALYAYRILKWKREISKYFFKYCVLFYKEHVRQKEAKQHFDDIDSASPSPLKRKKTGGLLMKDDPKYQKHSFKITKSDNESPPIKRRNTKVLLWAEEEIKEKIQQNRKKRNLQEIIGAHFKRQVEERILEEHDDQENDNSFNKIIQEEENYQELCEIEDEIKRQRETQEKSRIKNVSSEPNYFEKKKNQIKIIKKKRII